MPKPTKSKLHKKFNKNKILKNAKKKRKLMDEVSKDMNKNKSKTETRLNTPLTPYRPQNYDIELNVTPIRKKQFRREKRNCSESMNITNLNILFDSEFIYNGESRNNVFINKSNSLRRRSHSSIPKLSSPNLGESTRNHQYTQTPEKPKHSVFKFSGNEETPKGSKRFPDPVEDCTSERSIPILKHKFIANATSNKKFKNEVNFNPYVKNMEGVNREGVLTDTSFFSPTLFQQYSSTPIESRHRSLIENIDEFAYCKNNPKVMTISPRTPKYDNLNLNNTSTFSKILNKEESIRSLKMKTLNFSARRNSVDSPNSVFRINNQLHCSKIDVTQNSSLQVIIETTEMGCCESLFSKIKKCCKLTQYWTGKIMDICLQVGIQIKKSLSSLCATQNDQLQEKTHLYCNKCREYQEEIAKLSLRVLEVETINKENIESLNKELQKIREELGQFVNVRSEVEFLKEELKLMKQQPSNQCGIPPPPPPPPLPVGKIPPPPPPPPPPMALHSNQLVISKKKMNGLDEKENRPVISLDDILKVKLKKTNLPKPYQPTPTSRHTIQPSVSLDMLRQVKLRPSISTRSASIPTDETLDVTLSPNSNLCRLLKSEMTSGTRVKRLRRIGGLSYDSVYRSRKLNDRREREFDGES